MTSRPPLSAGSLLTAPVGRELMRLSGPTVFGLTAMLLFQVVNTFFVGMLGPEELAAISFTFPVTFAVMSIGMGIGLATTAVSAQAIGQGETSRVTRLTTHALLLAGMVTVVVSALGIWGEEVLFMHLLGAPERMLPLIEEYMTVYFASVAFLVIPMVGNSALRATGDTKTPSIIMIVAGIANAVLDPILIFGWGPVPSLGLHGAALASAIAWVITFFWAIYVLHARERMIEWKLPRWSELHDSWRTILTIGIPAVGSNLLIPIGQMVLTRLVSNFGALSVAAFGVGTRIESLAMIGVFAMSTALNPIVAQNYGARKLARVSEALGVAIKFCLVVGAATAVTLFVFALPLARIFSDSDQVAASASLYLKTVPWSYGLLGIGMTIPTLLNALSRANRSAILTAVRLFVCVLPLSYLGSELYGFRGLLLGLVAGNVLIGLISWLVARRTLQDVDRATSRSVAPAEASLPPAA
ncbi:MAG TPA: MATE family efflux transporter [Polyangiaceae bacterium]